MEEFIKTIIDNNYIKVAGFIVAIVAAFATACSAYYAARALRHKNRLTSVNIAAQALKEFAADEDMQRVFYLIEYKKFRYNRHTFHQSDMEPPTDKLLRHFAAVALAWKSKFVKTDALRIVRYYVLRILDNPHIQAYMRKVCRETQKDIPHIKEHPYHVLVELGEKLRESPPKSVHVVQCWDFRPGRKCWLCRWLCYRRQNRIPE